MFPMYLRCSRTVQEVVEVTLVEDLSQEGFQAVGLQVLGFQAVGRQVLGSQAVVLREEEALQEGAAICGVVPQEGAAIHGAVHQEVLRLLEALGVGTQVLGLSICMAGCTKKG